LQALDHTHVQQLLHDATDPIVSQR
jgi:hypothetical protein